jgi:hypothetical protein
VPNTRVPVSRKKFGEVFCSLALQREGIYTCASLCTVLLETVPDHSIEQMLASTGHCHMCQHLVVVRLAGSFLHFHQLRAFCE